MNKPLLSTPLVFESGLPSSRNEFISRDYLFLERLNRQIKQNISNQHCNVEFLARKMHLSVSQLNRKLNAIIGKPAGKWMREIRIEMAAKLLEHDVASVSEIAYQAGFSDHSHFCRSFKRTYGCTPSQYRKQYVVFTQLGFIN